MTSPSVGGRVLDASAVAALVRGRISVLTWLDVARATGMTLYLPTLALVEVRAVRPDSGPVLAELAGHEQVVLGELDAAAAVRVDRLLEHREVFDACAGHVALVAAEREWSVLSDDPGRLHRVDGRLEIDRL